MKKIAMLAVMAAVLAAAVFAPGCGDKKKNRIVIHDGQFAEMRVIHQMVKLLVEEYTKLKVDIRGELSPVNCFNTLVQGDCDLMNSYDGTVLTTFMRRDPSEMPEGARLYDFVNSEAMFKFKIRLLKQLGFNNTYAVAVPAQLAEKHNLVKISDLIPLAGDLVFGAEHDFFGEDGKMRFKPLAEFYGLRFKETRAFSIGRKYPSLESGDIDVTVAYSTDGLNKKAHVKILEDDRGFFPEYNCALLVRDDMFARFAKVAPNLEEVLNRLAGRITDDVMTSLNHEVDVNGRIPADVAKDFLKSNGLLK